MDELIDVIVEVTACEVAAAIAGIWPPSVTPSVVRAVEHELEGLERLSPGISESALAATALAMARELDDGENTASGMAACARVLDSVMADLRLEGRRRVPPQPDQPQTPEGDGIDQLATRRLARRPGP